MKKSAKIISLPLTLILVASITSILGCGNSNCVLTGFINCGGGGSGGGKSTINGNVADVIQGSGVAGIKVTAERNGKNADSDTTDSQGNFKLKVRKGDITLQFETSTFNVSREITVTKDSEVNLVVVLDPGLSLVTIENWQVLQDPIRCDNSDGFMFEEEEAIDFIINREGRDCIVAQGDCPVRIVTQNISFTNCNEGIRVEGRATVELEAVEDINLISKKDGIKTTDNAAVSLSAGNDIFITSTEENGIKAENLSDVEVQPTNQCTIQGSKNAIEQDATATVDPDGCAF